MGKEEGGVKTERTITGHTSGKEGSGSVTMSLTSGEAGRALPYPVSVAFNRAVHIPLF